MFRVNKLGVNFLRFIFAREKQNINIVSCLLHKFDNRRIIRRWVQSTPAGVRNTLSY